jgi:hypothetical protein
MSNSAPPGSSGPARPGLLGWLAVLAFLAVIVFVIPMGKTRQAETTLHEIFRLPDDAQVGNVKRPQDYGDGSLAEGTVQFSPEAYARYRQMVLDANRWTPWTLRWNDTPIHNTADPALQAWQPIDRGNPQRDPVLARSIQLRELGRVDAERGLALCFVAERSAGASARDRDAWQASDFTVRSCKAVLSDSRPHALVFGVLDDTRRTLTMKAQHGGLLSDRTQG